ncbi:TPA: hypothetical protein ACLX9M_000341 [Streptococcus pneumoniae]
MSEEKPNYKKNNSYRFKLWNTNIRKNWKLYISNLILYLIPVIVIEPNVSKYIVGKFVYVIILLVIIFLFNEFMKTIELMKNDLEVTKIKEKNKSLEKIRSDLEGYSESIGLFLENLPKEFLRNVSEFLDLKNSERISLYVLDGEKFRIIGRYSENPKYDRNGRCEYPSDCGYISKCLGNNNGNSYYVKEKLPKKLSKYVEAVSKDTGMNKDDINNLSMKSRTYFTRVIKDRHNKNVGILVIESMNPTLPMDVNELNTKLEELSIPHMSTFLDVSNKLKGGSSNE